MVAGHGTIPKPPPGLSKAIVRASSWPTSPSALLAQRDPLSSSQIRPPLCSKPPVASFHSRIKPVAFQWTVRPVWTWPYPIALTSHSLCAQSAPATLATSLSLQHPKCCMPQGLCTYSVLRLDYCPPDIGMTCFLPSCRLFTQKVTLSPKTSLTIPCTTAIPTTHHPHHNPSPCFFSYINYYH